MLMYMPSSKVIVSLHVTHRAIPFFGTTSLCPAPDSRRTLSSISCSVGSVPSGGENHSLQLLGLCIKSPLELYDESDSLIQVMKDIVGMVMNPRRQIHIFW